ncbi:uncharacterized coiled-coil DUF342 family protein [Peribacillus deserti]|uniref:Uncharacterized coiled-coil DUF342 family protein n=1 Tax=Peribacillus deserti TaxID=673318 RepID=A0ABS2QJA6_9BACI|nr:YppE family protein [Peribacillus deserti]MBM7692603.1 uncharacterized coiled-coil DUF342 family protein [Peribacillus deserti]
MNSTHAILVTATEELLKLTDQIEAIFDEVKADKQERDFFEEVRPFAESAQNLSDKWVEMAKEYVMLEKPKHIYREQIEQAGELVSTCSVQAFFPSTSLKRFKNQLQSIRYTLEGLLTHLKDNLHLS